MSEQFAKTSLDEAIHEYQLGFITATGLVRLWVKIKLAYGWRQEYSPKEIYGYLGISKGAFYKAIATLKTLGYINFDVKGKMGITNTEPKGGILNKNQLSANVNHGAQMETEFTDDDNLATFVNSESTFVNSESTFVNSESTFVNSESSKPAPRKNPGGGPDYIQINQIKSDLHQADDDDFDFWLKKKLDDAGVKNHEAYLKTLDKTTGQPLIEKFRTEYSQRNKNTPGSLTAYQAWEKALKLSANYSGGQLRDYLNPSEEPQLFEAIRKTGGLAAIGGSPTHQLHQLKSAFTEAFNNYQAPVLA
jgi:hypothetical protein